MFELLYHPHGGSGLSLSREDVLDLELGERDFFLEHLADRREQEARALEAAARKGRR
jgi:hypothetical protein